MYDDDYPYDDGYFDGPDSDAPDDACMFEDGFFPFVGDVPDDDEAWDETRELIHRHEAEQARKEAFKQEGPDLFFGSLSDPAAFDGADAVRLLFVFRLYRAFEKKVKDDCPKGLYGAAVMLSQLYDELFPNGTY